MDWGWTSPTKRDIVRRTEEEMRPLNTINRQQDDSKQSDLLDVLINITMSEVMDRELKGETIRTFEQGKGGGQKK